MNDVQTQREFVLRRLAEPWLVGGREASGSLWLAVLIPVLLVGLAYVVWMYRRDSRSIAWPWAALLGLCRGAVYLTLAAVFLLPAFQTWETTQKQSRVVVLVDVSPSMARHSDDLPPEDGRPALLATRLDKVTSFLGEAKPEFIAALTEKNPVTVYRFAARLDDDPAVFEKGQPTWDAARWQRWLGLDLKQWLLDQLDGPSGAELLKHPAFEADKPGTAEWAADYGRRPVAEILPGGLDDAQKETFLAARARLDKRAESVRQLRLGTDVGESALQLLNREGNTMLQGVVVLSDGRGTLGTDASLAEVRARAARDRVPVFAVQVGEDRPPVEIRIADVQTPEQTPPNEKFVVRAELDGVGLPEYETPVFLDIFGPGADGPTHTLETRVQFQPGSPPHAQAEFTLDPDPVQGLPGALFAGEKKEFVEGEWRFVVRVPREKRESFAGKEHVSPPTTVQVIKKPLRVLLVASGPSHDYQFLRTLLVREKDARRAEVSVFLQNEGRDGRAVQDVEPERLLSRFPSTLRVEDAPEEKPEDRYYNLARYDVIVAYDPDWSEFSAEQLELIKRWVDTQAGGLVIVAGPVNTFQLARGEEGGRLKPLLDLFPVVPGDVVLLGSAGRRSARTPFRLNFAGASPDMEFLKLDDDAKEATAGWKEFFDGPAERPGEQPRRGFYNAYPVKSVKPGASVVASFPDPSMRMADGKEQPFLVTMPYGKGRVVFLGSDEMRRLRQFREVYYERFWMKLARWASAGGRGRQARRGVLVMGREFAAGGFVRVEAQLFGPTLEPLPRTARAKLASMPADAPNDRREVELTAKPGSGEWAGWFQARFPAATPGDYKLELPIPGSGDVLRGKFTVKATDPELDNPRPDPAALFQIAGELREVEDRIADSADREAVRARLRGAALSSGEAAPPAAETPRLLFALAGADVIPKCMTTQRKEQRNRGAVDDLWDKGPVVARTDSDRPLVVSAVLLLVVGLLSAEWLGRKLLRLA